MIEAKSLATFEHFAPTLSLKLATQAQGMIEGYASTFNGEPDRVGDVVAPGAFLKSLAEHKAYDTTPAMLWQHDPAAPIGKWLTLKEDTTGLKVQGQLTLAVSRAQDAYALAKDGALALSIGYRARDYARLAGGNRLLKDLELGEISLVSIAANPAARISAVKSAAEITNPRAFEAFLRDAGFPRSFAKAITAHGFKAAAGLRDVGGEGSPELARLIRESATRFEKFTKG